jgi:predicted outer membrane repeat protein
MTHNLFFGNTALLQGGGVCCEEDLVTTIKNSIFWNNTAAAGKAIYIGDYFTPSSLTIDHCNVQGGQSSVFIEMNSTLNWNQGMIDADPRFVSGPRGPFYLAQIAAGQSVKSPCVDAGDPASGMISGTTRTDALQDAGIVDMGFHYPLDALPDGAAGGPAKVYPGRSMEEVPGDAAKFKGRE